MKKYVIRTAAVIAATLIGGQAVVAGPGLLMPDFNAELGRTLFASKGCVVCHSVNGIGGIDAAALDYDPEGGPMDPFDFAAKMWRGAETMIYMQQDELGDQIQLTGPELAAIIAFAHDEEQQALFSMDDIPENIREMLHGSDEEHDESEPDADHDEKPDSDEDHD
ncbi:MAG: cytochrome c [Rhodobacteraceae bacterium]|nr:cytochrome c [Paracoccaceae bacterium]